MSNSQKLITGKVRFSYANVWEPKSINGGDEKYSVSIIIPKSDKQTLALINDAIKVAEKAGIAKFGSKFTSCFLQVKIPQFCKKFSPGTSGELLCKPFLYHPSFLP